MINAPKFCGTDGPLELKGCSGLDWDLGFKVFPSRVSKGSKTRGFSLGAFLS